MGSLVILSVPKLFPKKDIIKYANGGYLIRPQIIYKIKNKNEILYESKPEVIRKVITKNTTRRIISILEQVVENGSGLRAHINGFKIAGKTGTSETFINGKKSNTNYISSFADMRTKI